MTAEELKNERLALGFRSRNALAKALGVSKYAVNTGNTAAGPFPAG